LGHPCPLPFGVGVVDRGLVGHKTGGNKNDGVKSNNRKYC